MGAYPYAIQRKRYDSPMPTSYRRWTSNGPIGNSLGEFVEVTNPKSGPAWRLLQMVRAKHGRHGKRTPKGVIPELLAAMEEARFKIITKSTMSQSCVLTRPEYDASTNSRDLFPTGQLYDDAKHHGAEAVRQDQLVAITADIVAAQCSPGIREALIEGMLEAANESRNVHQIALLPVTIDTAIEIMRGQHGKNPDTHWDRGKAPRYKDSLKAARMLSSLFQQDDKKATKQDRPDNALGRKDDPWGNAIMQTPRLDATCKSSRAARAFRATDEGYLFKYPQPTATCGQRPGANVRALFWWTAPAPWASPPRNSTRSWPKCPRPQSPPTRATATKRGDGSGSWPVAARGLGLGYRSTHRARTARTSSTAPRSSGWPPRRTRGFGCQMDGS